MLNSQWDKIDWELLDNNAPAIPEKVDSIREWPRGVLNASIILPYTLEEAMIYKRGAIDYDIHNDQFILHFRPTVSDAGKLSCLANIESVWLVFDSEKESIF